MLHSNKKLRVSMASAIVALTGSVLSAQDTCGCYQVVPQTTYRPQVVTTYRLVDETTYERQQVTSYKPVWITEQRERRYKVLKPVHETSERTEEYTVLKPVVERSYIEKSYEETYLEEQTEMRDQEYVVEKPIVETSYQEQSYIVRKPVTEMVTTSEQITVMRPTTTLETQYTMGTTLTNQFALQPQGYTVPRLRYDRRGYYPDPGSGAMVYQRGGLQWARYPRPANYAVQSVPTATLIPQQIATTTMVPETVVVQKPIEVTRYVDEVVTSRVPITTQSVQRQVVTQKVPVTVQVQKKRIVTEKVPVDSVRYVSQVETRKVPVTNVRYEEIERVEPFEVQVLKYVAENREIQVPRTATRRIPLTTTQLVPESQWLRLPVETSRLALPETSSDRQLLYSVPLVVDPNQYSPTGQVINGIPVIEAKPLRESSVIVPKSVIQNAQTPIDDVQRPAAPGSVDTRSGDDSAEKTVEPKQEGQPAGAVPNTAEPKTEADTQPSLNQG